MLFGCGTGRPSEALIRASSDMRLQESELMARGERAPRGGITVNVYIHVVSRDQTVSGGFISVSRAIVGFCPLASRPK